MVNTRHSVHANRRAEALMPVSRPGSTDCPAEEQWLLVRRGSPSFGVLVCGTALAEPHTPNLAPVNLPSSMKELVFLPAGPPTSLGFPQCCLSKSFCCRGCYLGPETLGMEKLAALGLATNSALSQQPGGFLLTRTTVSFILGLSEVWPTESPALLLLAWASPDGVPPKGQTPMRFQGI